MLEAVEAAAPPEARGFELFTGAGSAANIRRYKRAGYRLAGTPAPGVVRLEKRRR